MRKQSESFTSLRVNESGYAGESRNDLFSEAWERRFEAFPGQISQMIEPTRLHRLTAERH